jgi:imidazole glycerol-phosphate synthase subunit HisH
MSTRVTIVDYGLGNLHSVANALTHLGASVDYAEDGKAIATAERLILPGVGAFADGMRNLTDRGQVQALRVFARSGRPFIGICLGMQLLFDESDEFGTHAGLGIIPGRVERIPAAVGVKVPHVGWNRLNPARDGAWDGSLLADTPAGTFAYFVHSFAAKPRDAAHLLAVATYGPHRLTAAVSTGAVTGFQYHPEKSGAAGLAMLRAFLAAPSPLEVP